MGEHELRSASPLNSSVYLLMNDKGEAPLFCYTGYSHGGEHPAAKSDIYIIDYIPEIPMGTLQINERYSYAAGEWREPFAEAQVPYDELMGFAKFAATFAR